MLVTSCVDIVLQDTGKDLALVEAEAGKLEKETRINFLQMSYFGKVMSNAKKNVYFVAPANFAKDEFPAILAAVQEPQGGGLGISVLWLPIDFFYL